MKLTVDECYELETDYQNQFLGNEVFPNPQYKKLKLSERSINQVHYNDVYILEPTHYYYITFLEDVLEDDQIKILDNYFFNGLIPFRSVKKNRFYLFNASKNIIYIQKGAQIAEVI